MRKEDKDDRGNVGVGEGGEPPRWGLGERKLSHWWMIVQR